MDELISRMTVRRRDRHTSPLHALLLVFALCAACSQCTSSTDNQPPTVVLSGTPSGPFVVGDTLLISMRGWTGVSHYQFTREQIKDITVGESTVQINDEHLPELHIALHQYDTLELFTARDREELTWLAHTLKKALQLESSEAADATADANR